MGTKSVLNHVLQLKQIRMQRRDLHQMHIC
nr:MAG TPA: hypothetical protein [Caudoviricetes sp.]